MVQSTAPTSGTLSLKVFSIPALLFLLMALLLLPHLLDISVLVSVLFLLLYGGVGMWPACVSLPILLNVSPVSLLVGVLLPFFPSWWEICTAGSVLILISFKLIGVPIGVFVSNFSQRSGVRLVICLKFLSILYPLNFLSYVLK